MKHWAHVQEDEEVTFAMKDALLNAFAVEPVYVEKRVYPCPVRAPGIRVLSALVEIM